MPEPKLNTLLKYKYEVVFDLWLTASRKALTLVMMWRWKDKKNSTITAALVQETNGLVGATAKNALFQVHNQNSSLLKHANWWEEC